MVKAGVLRIPPGHRPTRGEIRSVRKSRLPGLLAGYRPGVKEHGPTGPSTWQRAGSYFQTKRDYDHVLTFALAKYWYKAAPGAWERLALGSDWGRTLLILRDLVEDPTKAVIHIADINKDNLAWARLPGLPFSFTVVPRSEGMRVLCKRGRMPSLPPAAWRRLRKSGDGFSKALEACHACCVCRNLRPPSFTCLEVTPRLIWPLSF